MNLAGEDGNIFMLVGAFRRNAKRQGWTETEMNVVCNSVSNSKSYDEALQVLIGVTEPVAD